MPLLTVPQWQPNDANGNVLGGAKLNTYESGTSTPKATYSDSALTSAHANPVVADSAGRFPPIYTLSEDYKLVLTDSSDNVIETNDPFAGTKLASTSDGLTDTATASTLTISDTKVAVDGPSLVVGTLVTAGDGLAHLFGGSAGTVTSASDADELTIEDDNTVGMTFLHPDAQTANIHMGAPSGTTYVQIQGSYNSGSPFLKFTVDGAERFRIADDARLPVNRASTFLTTVQTGTTAPVNDDSIPQNTEGDEYITVAITPQLSTNKLVIEVDLFCASSGGSGNNVIIVALFQDSTANALAAVSQACGTADLPQTIRLRHEMTAGTTSSTTFKVRAGTFGTLTVNGTAGARKFGGVANSSITVTEYTP